MSCPYNIDCLLCNLYASSDGEKDFDQKALISNHVPSAVKIDSLIYICLSKKLEYHIFIFLCNSLLDGLNSTMILKLLNGRDSTLLLKNGILCIYCSV